MRKLLAVLSLLALASCASLPPVCAPPGRSMVTVEMLFGRKIGNRLGVSDKDFTAFINDEITPRFPDGITVVDARGQWRDAKRNVIVREPSKLVKLLFAEDAQKRADVAALVDSYKRKFSQESVLVSMQASCATF